MMTGRIAETMQDAFATMVSEIRACRHCAGSLPCGPRPVVQAGPSARLRIVGQAPGRKVHESGIPWDDASGRRLRDWLRLDPADFYDPAKVAIIPMGFCYPGKAASGDNPPRAECAPRWHGRLNAHLPDIGLTILVGQYAQAHYLGGDRKATLGDTVKAWKEYLPSGHFPLPHPSPRNQPWFARNPWFGTELLPHVRAAVRALEL